MKRWILLLAGCWLLAVSPALAGTEITIETRKASAPPDAVPQRSVVEVEGRSLRAEAGDGRHGAIWRGVDGVLQILDHREQTIVSIDRATARSLSQGVEGVRGQVAGLPKAQREVVEGWIGGEPPARLELRGSGQRAQVSGVSCRLLEALRDGVRLAEICEGPVGAAGVSAGALAPVRELAAFLAEVGDLLPRSLSADGLEALVLVKQLDGVPLRVRAWPKGGAATEARIVSAQPKSFGPERFQPPPGYQAGLGVHLRE